MIDHEKQVYTLVSNALKEKFETIQTTDQKLRFYDSTYPVISLIQQIIMFCKIVVHSMIWEQIMLSNMRLKFNLKLVWMKSKQL